MQDYGQADAIQAQLGLTPEIGVKIAAIISFSGAIEHFLERALWRLRGINPQGTKPDTDGKIITHLIGMLEEFGETLTDNDQRTLVATWCKAARYGFVIRNNIAHGVPAKVGNTLTYARNPRWEGEERKREFGDFWADLPTLDLVCEAMAVLYRSIANLSKDGQSLANVTNEETLKALRTARSVLGEFASQDYNPSFEKY